MKFKLKNISAVGFKNLNPKVTRSLFNWHFYVWMNCQLIIVYKILWENKNNSFFESVAMARYNGHVFKIFIYLFKRKGRVVNWHITIEITELTGQFCDSNMAARWATISQSRYDNIHVISYNNLSGNCSSGLCNALITLSTSVLR